GLALALRAGAATLTPSTDPGGAAFGPFHGSLHGPSHCPFHGPFRAEGVPLNTIAETGERIAPPAASAELFGHPRGLAYIAFTEAWERFSFYGMQALLVLYMSGYLLQPGVVEQVAGLDRKSTRLNSSHVKISYAVFCLKKKKN